MSDHRKATPHSLAQPAIKKPAPSAAEVKSLQRLKSLRKSPGYTLIAHSALFLQTWQLDMDYPPSLRAFVRKQMSHLLKQKTGQSLAPDELHITFITEDNPAVASDGAEHFSLRLSLTELGMACFDSRYFLALTACPVEDDALSPGLTATSLIALLRETSWDMDYDEHFATFWRHHEKTYRALIKLSFLDQLGRQHTRKKISRDGYYLALNTLGLDHFPTSADCLTTFARGQQAEVYMLALDGDLLPGLFQLRSKASSHCFIHRLGHQDVIEYISDEPQQMASRMLSALNGAHRLNHPPDKAERLKATLIDGDLFDALSRAMKDSPLFDDDHEPLMPLTNIDLLQPIRRGLALVSAVDIWEVRPVVLEHVPSLTDSAAEVIHNALHTRHGLSLNPDHVFIRYLPGTSVQPLGNVRQAPSYFHVPDDKPISLSTALISNYRVEHPVGYIDEGGRSVVYLDPTGKGEWSGQSTLAISPETIEETIKTIDFLALMTAQIKHFWVQHKDAIEDALLAGLLAQAVVCLKCGNLSRSGFDRVVKAIASPADPTSDLQWLTLGFDVYSTFIKGVERQYCAGLLILKARDKPQQILYQPGQPKAFNEFTDRDALIGHLRTRAADEAWRQTILACIPGRHQERLGYLLSIWGGQAPADPVSVLRPWTDINYNPDVHDALAQELHEKVLDGSPFTYIRSTLMDNSLEEAQATIVTSREVTLRYWTRQLSHLQLLLAPLSLLLAPAALAAIAVEVGLLALDIAAAHLPGQRDAEKQQAVLTALTLGLFYLTPATPRLLQSLRRMTGPPRTVAVRSAHTATTHAHRPGGLYNHSVQARRTHLEPFFHTGSLLKGWTVPANAAASRVAIKVWKLERRFLLWTTERLQSTTLLVSTHGHYLPWSRTVAIPNGSEILTYAPHGFKLLDPQLNHVIHRRVRPFALSNTAGNTPIKSPGSQTPLEMTDKLMAGTALPGRLKNYTLSKFQDVGETYDDICNVVSHSNRSPFRNQLPPVPTDVLTVRNRFGMGAPSLDDLFRVLFEKGIHYDRILLVHCRCPVFDALLRPTPPFVAPSISPRDHP